MALLGGAGNVGGSNPAGTGASLNYIGDHCYAYSGPITSTDATAADATMFLFTTGSSYIIASIDYADQESGSDKRFLLAEINDETVYTSDFDDAPWKGMSPFLKILIPPYSKFKLSYGMAGVNVIAAAVLTGRVYS